MKTVRVGVVCRLAARGSDGEEVWDGVTEGEIASVGLFVFGDVC